ncbi:MAG: phospholipid carrier-dependent glycosyltransferase [Azospirillum sp.]|nr:phospholipid carrier-dependent glycosyltransferase [Azospirillum sp.]
MALVVLCLVLFLPGLFRLPPFDRDEARFAQASRQMVESGDLVDIRFQEEPRHKKPAGIYWLQAAAASLVGPADHSAIWPYRLPSLIGAVAAVLLTAWAGEALFGASVGLLGALMLAGCLVLGVEARMAKTDACLLASVLLAQGVLARVWLGRLGSDRPGWGLTCLFWAALGIGILIKGPIGPMVTVATAAALCLAERRAGWLKRLRPVSGLVSVLAIAAPWLVAIGLQTKGAFFAEAIGHDLLAKVASGQESKGLPPGFYLATFWITFWPFAFPALLAVPWVWRRRADPAVAFCLAWLLPTWLVFELVPTKLLHYTLPMFPAIALLTAAAAFDQFDRSLERPRRRLFVVGAWMAVLVSMTLAGGLVALPWLVDQRDDRLAVLVAPAILVLAGYAVVALWKRQGRAALALAVLGAGVVYGFGFGVVLPRLDGIWLSRTAARVVAAHRPCPTSVVAAAGYGEPSLVFLLGTATRMGTGEAAAEHLLADPSCALALVEARQDEAFHRALGATGVLPLADFSGFNYSNGKGMTLVLYRLAPLAPPAGGATGG